MNKTIKILTIVLVLQALLVILTNLEHFKTDSDKQQSRLLAFDWQQIDGFRITGKESASVLLKKKSEHEWFIPNYYNLAVDNTKIDELLNKLKPLKTDWPVATTEEASRRFEVSKENFQRQIAFLQGETTKSNLLTGTSPGYRKVHARLDNQNAIYAIELSNFLASTNAEDWLKKQLLAMDLNPVKKITVGDIQLTKADKEWILDGLSTDQKLNQTKLQPLLDAITTFSVEAAFGPDATIVQNQPQIANVIFDFGAEQQQWSFYEPKEGAHLIVKSTQNPNYFKVNRAIADKITTITREQLIEKATLQSTPVSDAPDQATTIESSEANIDLPAATSENPILPKETSGPMAP
jgi:hypothetical protein